MSSAVAQSTASARAVVEAVGIEHRASRPFRQLQEASLEQYPRSEVERELVDLSAGWESPGRGWNLLRRYETTQDVTAPERIAEPDLLSFLLSLDVRPVRMNLAV